MMASVHMRQEICLICGDNYNDPVKLNCGHYFCWRCINMRLDTQERNQEDYCCPQCRKRSRERPALHRNTDRCNTDEGSRSGPSVVQTNIFCTYCIHTSILAVTFCLHCDAFLCGDHRRVHSKAPEHVLQDPATTMKNRKCSIHNRILEYYCTEDATCICVYCRLVGEHQEHKVETLVDALKKKKEKLRNDFQKMIKVTEETEKRVHSQQERKSKAAEVTETVRALFRDFQGQLVDLEKTVLMEVSRQETEASQLLSDLQNKKDELTVKMRHTETLCDTTDALTVLQHQETNHEEAQHDGSTDLDLPVEFCDLDEFLISLMLQQGLSDIMEKKGAKFPALRPTRIELDVKTAANDILLSGNRKMASWIQKAKKRRRIPERFHYNWVLSTNTFSSGKHYWLVETNNWRGDWAVGMCYPSVDRRWSWKRNSKKCWCIRKSAASFSIKHDGKSIPLSTEFSYSKLGIYLDYNAGRLSFYALCDPVRHLHTFIVTFTEPLHAAFCLCKSTDGQECWIKVK